MIQFVILIAKVRFVIYFTLVAKPASRDTPICLDASPVCLDVPICFDTPCMYGHPHMFGCPLYACMPHMFGCTHYMFGCPHVWTPPYVWTSSCMFWCFHMFGHPLCLNASLYVWKLPMFGCPQMFGHPHIFGCPPIFWCTPCMFGCLQYVWIPPVSLDTPYVWMPPVCLEDVWMPVVHVQQKESMLCQTEGVSICPIHLDTPCMFGHPHMLGWLPVCLESPYVLMSPYARTPPICLDASFIWMHPVYVSTLPYVWMPAVCLDAPNIYLDTLICLDTFHMFGSPPFIWMHPCMFGCHHMLR